MLGVVIHKLSLDLLCNSRTMQIMCGMFLYNSLLFGRKSHESIYFAVLYDFNLYSKIINFIILKR